MSLEEALRKIQILELENVQELTQYSVEKRNGYLKKLKDSQR